MLERVLAGVVGADHVITDPELRAGYEVDWTGRWRGTARAVVRPGSAAEVAAVLRACADAGVPVVPQGGNTGLVGGSVPGPTRGPAPAAGGGSIPGAGGGPVPPAGGTGGPAAGGPGTGGAVVRPGGGGAPGGAVVVSTRRLVGRGAVGADGTVVVGAGATLAAVQAHARAAGWQLGLDWAARDSATVGGAVATNAGGLRVLRWGPARAQLVGVEVALASGELLTRVTGPLKDSTGYDLSGLLCGSEGTLGVLTRVRLRLVPPLPARRAVALAGVPDVGAAQALLAAARRLDLAAAELIGAAALDLVDLPAPLPDRWPAYVLLETVGPVDELAEALAGAGDAVLAGDAADRARLWRYREEITPSISGAGVPVKLDVSVPADRLAEVWTALDVPGTVLFGHLAEANLHVNVLGAADEDAVADRVLRLVAAAGGSISAEHGIGRAKTRWLPLTRSPAELAAMRAVKKALDPAGILNPEVLLP